VNTMLRCWVNGELRQEASTSDLIFDIPTLIETCSRGITLYPATSSRPVAGRRGMGMTPRNFSRRRYRAYHDRRHRNAREFGAVIMTATQSAVGGSDMANVLFTNVRIIDGSGAQPYSGEVSSRNRIARVARGTREYR